MRLLVAVLSVFLLSTFGCRSSAPVDPSAVSDACGGLGCPLCQAGMSEPPYCHSAGSCSTSADCTASFGGSCSSSLGTWTEDFALLDCREGRCIYQHVANSCVDLTPCASCSARGLAAACPRAPSVSECVTCCAPTGADPTVVAGFGGCACGVDGPCASVCSDSLLCGGAYATSEPCAQCLVETLAVGGACAGSAAFQQSCLRSPDSAACRTAATCVWSCGTSAATTAVDGGVPPDPAATDCPLAACCYPDSDTITASFAVTSLRLPTTVVGFDLDRRNDATPPYGSGPTKPGCGAVDATGGWDAALGTTTQHVAPSFDWDATLAAWFAGGMGGSPSPAALTLSLGRLAAGPYDACIDVTLDLVVDGYPQQTLRGHATSAANGTDRLLLARLEGALIVPLPGSTGVPASGCQGGTCAEGSLVVTVRDLRLSLRLDATMTTVLPGSYLGGYVFYGDGSSVYARVSASALESSLSSFAAQAGLTSSYASELSTSFQDALDLHMDSDETLGTCSGATLTTLNPNALSIALALEGAAL